MSEQDSTPAEGQTPEATPEAKPESKTFDEAYVKELRAEAAKWRTQAKQSSEEAEELKERDKSELEKALSKVAKAEKAKAEAEVALTRYQVAAEKNVPADALDLLTGDSREELEAKADKLLELTKARTPEPDFDGGAREPAPEPKTPEEAHNDTFLEALGLKPRT